MEIDINLILEEYKKQVGKLINDQVILTCQVKQLTQELNQLKKQIDQIEEKDDNVKGCDI